MTWTFHIVLPKTTFYGVVSAENTEVARKLVYEELRAMGWQVSITNEQLIPMVTSTRKVRILNG